MKNKTYFTVSKLIGFIVLILSSFILLLLALFKIHILIDIFPFVFNIIIYPLPTLLLVLYESSYQLPLSNFAFFIIGYLSIFIFYFLFFISGISIIKTNNGRIKMFTVLTILNVIFGITLLLISKFIIAIPFYIVLYGLFLFSIERYERSQTTKIK